jgi:hypothetical protein
MLIHILGDAELMPDARLASTRERMEAVQMGLKFQSARWF